MLYEGTKNYGAARVGLAGWGGGGGSILRQDFFWEVTSACRECHEFSLVLASLKWATMTLGPSPVLISALEDICSVQLQWRRSHFKKGKTEGVHQRGC